MSGTLASLMSDMALLRCGLEEGNPYCVRSGAMRQPFLRTNCCPRRDIACRRGGKRLRHASLRTQWYRFGSTFDSHDTPPHCQAGMRSNGEIAVQACCKASWRIAALAGLVDGN